MINNQNIGVLSEKVAHLESVVSNSTSASGISYDNTESGLTADDVQGAIDELSEASGIAYDNTNSGLTASNVQAAIDEIAGAVKPETVTITLNSDTVDAPEVDSYMKVYRIGKMVIVNIPAIKAKTAWGAQDVLATGLPIPVFKETACVWAQGQKAYRVRVSDTGALSNWYDNITIGDVITGAFVYVAL